MEKSIAELEKRMAVLESKVAKLESKRGIPSGKKEAGSLKKLSIKEFLRSKNIKSKVQRILLVGYYLEKHNAETSFNSKDLQNALRLAKEPLPSNINAFINQNIINGHIMEDSEKKDNKKAFVLTNTGELFVENEMSSQGKMEKPKTHSVKPKTAKSKSAKPKSAKSKTTQSLLKDLDLSGDSNKSLNDFYNQYSPQNNMERNLVFAYYLEHIVDETPVTLDHVFTCYRHMKIKLPKALHQSLIDAARHHGWLDTSSMSEIKVPVAGINHIEHDMEKKTE